MSNVHMGTRMNSAILIAILIAIVTAKVDTDSVFQNKALHPPHPPNATAYLVILALPRSINSNIEYRINVLEVTRDLSQPVQRMSPSADIWH